MEALVSIGSCALKSLELKMSGSFIDVVSQPVSHRRHAPATTTRFVRLIITMRVLRQSLAFRNNAQHAIGPLRLPQGPKIT
jgi:hypothetical protein